MSDPLQHGENAPPPPDPPATSPNPENPPEGGGEEKPMNRFAERRRTLISRTAVRGSDGKANLQLLASGFAKPKPKEDNPETPVDAAADGGESNGAKSADDVIVKTTTPTPAVDPALPPQTPDPKQQQKQPAALPHSSTPEGKTDSTHSTPILVDPSLPQHISQTSITTTITTETIHTTTPPPPTNPNSNITQHSPTGTTRFVDDNNNPLSPQPANQGSTNPNNNNNNNNTKQNKNNDDILHQSYTTPSELVMSPSTSDLFLIHNNINSPSNGYAEVIVKHNPPSQNPTPAPLPEPLGQSPQKSQRPNNNTTTPHPTTPGGGPPTHQKRASIVDRLFRRSSVTKNEASTTATTPTDHPITPHAQLPPQQQPHQQQSTTPQAGHRSFLTRRFSQDDTAVDFSKTNNNNNTNNNPNNTNHNSNNNNTAAGNINLPPCNASHQKDLPSGSGGGGGVTASPTLLKNLQYDCVDSDDDELVLITRQDSAFAALKLRSSGANGIPPGLFCENEDDDNDDDHQTDASDAEKECIVRKAPSRGAGSGINKPTVPPHCTPTHEGKRLEASGDNNNQDNTNINTQHNNTTGNIYNNTCNQPATALSGKFPPLTISKAHSVDYDQDDVLTPLSRVNTSRVSSNNGTTNPTNRYTFSPLQKPETNPHTTLPPLATPTISSAAITNPDSTNGAAIGGDSSQNPTPPSPTASTTSLRMRRQALMGQKRTFQFMSPAQAPPPQATTTTTTTTINPPTTSLNTPQRPAHSPATTTTTLNTTIESSVSSTSPRHATTALSVGQSDTANTPIKPNNTTNNNNTPATVDDDGEIHFVRPTTPLILQSPGPLKIDNTTADSDCHTPPATTRAYDPNNDPHAVPTPPQQPQQSGQSSLESLKQFLDQKGKFYSLISPTTVQRTPTAKQFLPSDLTPAAGTPGTTRPFSFDDKTNGNDSTLDDDGDMVVKKPSANKAKRSKEDETDESDTELLRMPPETQDNTDLNKGDCELTETIRNALQLKRMYNIKRQTFCRCFQPQIVETTTTPTTEEGKQQQCRYDIKYYTDHHPLPQYLTQNTIRAYCDELKALWDKCGLCDLPVQYTKHPYYIYLQKLNKELTTQQQQEEQPQQQKITNTTTSPAALNDDEYYSAIHHVELAHDDDDNDLVHKLMQMHTIYTSEPFYGTPYDNIGKYDDERVDVFYYKPSSSLSSANASDNNDKQQQQQQQQQQQPKKDTAHLFYSSPTLIDDAILALHRKRPKKSVLFDHIEQQEQLSTVAEEEKRKHDKNNKKMSSSRSLSFDNNIATKLVIPRLLLSFPRLPLDKAHGADVDNHYHTYRNAGEQQQPQQQNQQQQDQQNQQQEQEEDEEIEYDTNYNPYHHDIIVDVDENASSSTNNTNDTTNSLDTTNINQTTPPQQQRLMGQQPDLQPYDPFQPPVPTPVATNSPSTGSNGTQHTLPQTLLSPPPRGSNFDRVMSFQIVDIVDGNSPAVVGTDHFMHNNPSGSGSHSRYHSNNNGDGTNNNNNNKEMPSPLLATISKNAAVFKQ